MLVRVLPKVVVGTGSQYMINRITVGIGSHYLRRVVEEQGRAGRGPTPGTITVGTGSHYLRRIVKV